MDFWTFFHNDLWDFVDPFDFTIPNTISSPGKCDLNFISTLSNLSLNWL